MHFIPNKNPIHRQKPVANAKHRLAMVRIATEKYPDFMTNDVEMNRSGPSYTIDTIKNIRKHTPGQPLCFILGQDAFSRMNHWYDWEAIPELVHLVIINRPATPFTDEPWMQTLLADRSIHDIQELRSKPGGYILQQEIQPMAISATEIRRKLKEEKDVSEELFPEVLRYIKQHHLYT